MLLLLIRHTNLVLHGASDKASSFYPVSVQIVYSMFLLLLRVPVQFRCRPSLVLLFVVMLITLHIAALYVI